jgi:lipopolysaccharide export system ATP-binding protein
MSIQVKEDVTGFIHQKGIVVQDINKSYGKKKVVNSVNFHVQQGEIVGLLGPNGAGKTTTFYMIVGLITPNSGSVLLDSENIERYPMYYRARLGIGYLPRKRPFSGRCRLKIHSLRPGHPGTFQRRDRDGYQRFVGRTRFAEYTQAKGYTLSGGEKRRTEVARILAIEPRFLLLDEPFTGIDPIAIADIQKIILHLKEKRGLGILITDHNVRETLKITNRAYIIHEGKILVGGTSEELIKSKEAKKYYLGMDFIM